MSTTTDRNIALNYGGAANASDKPSIIFEMQVGMIDRGAPVQWCSQFPEEAEILFAPLTGCEVVGMPKVEKSVIVVELRLNCNLHDLTIEQILAKMQKVGSFVASLFLPCTLVLLCVPCAAGADAFRFAGHCSHGSYAVRIPTGGVRSVQGAQNQDEK